MKWMSFFRGRRGGQWFAATVLLSLAAGSGGGCAALPLATLGTMAGITASAVSTTNDIYRLGKLDTAEMARMDDAIIAAGRAAGDLDLRLKSPFQAEAGVAQFSYEDAKEAELAVRIERRTAALVRIRIDVGLFGSEVTARLFMARLRAHLPHQGEPDFIPMPKQEMEKERMEAELDPSTAIDCHHPPPWASVHDCIRLSRVAGARSVSYSSSVPTEENMQANEPILDASRPVSPAAPTPPREHWVFQPRRAYEAAVGLHGGASASSRPAHRSCCEEMERWDGMS